MQLLLLLLLRSQVSCCLLAIKDLIRLVLLLLLLVIKLNNIKVGIVMLPNELSLRNIGEIILDLLKRLGLWENNSAQGFTRFDVLQL